MFEIVMLAALAGFIFFRLHSVLGQRTGHEKTSRSPFESSAADNVVKIPEHRVQRAPVKQEADIIPKDHPCVEGLQSIASADKTFKFKAFMKGAQSAFEMIMQAFTEGKTDVLKKLLDKALLQDFTNEIKARKERKESLSLKILGFDEVQIIEAFLEKKTAYITVRYDTQQKLSVTAEGQDPVETTENVIDTWTFSKEVKASNPNWTLVSTQAHPVLNA